MRSTRLLPLLLCLAPALGCDFLFPDLQDEDADPAFAVDAQGTVYGLAGGADSVEVLWTAEVDPADAALIEVAGGTLVIGAGRRVHGLDSDTGDALWVADLADQVVGMTQGDGRVYALTFTGLTAVSIEDGSVAWTLDFTAENISGVSFADPVFASGAVYLGGDPVRRVEGIQPV